GQVVLQLKSPYKDGTTHIVMEPLEFMERLAALVPRPRLHLMRFHGVLAPNAKLRSKIVPAPAEPAPETSSGDAQAQGAPARRVDLVQTIRGAEHRLPTQADGAARSEFQARA